MNITQCIIITDTNIITDLHTAKILEQFLNLDNVFVSDMILNDEINEMSCSLDEKKLIKVIASTSEELIEVMEIAKIEKQLSIYDILNYILARDNDGILATGDNRLKKYAEENSIEVLRTLKIISIMSKEGIITKKEELDAYNLLNDCYKTRIPKEEIERKIEEISKITS